MRVEPLGLAMPGSCACCGAPASSSRLEIRPGDGTSLIIPYCDGCQRHASRATTRSLAAGIAALLVALTLSLGLPLAWPGASLASFVLVVAACALFPLLVAGAFPPRPAPGHSAAGRASWWSSGGELVCTNSRWAAELASSAGVDARVARIRERALSPWILAGPIVALIVAPIAHRFHHPRVRVLNLTEARIEIYVDGEQLGSIDPTSAESPAAGAELRLPTGKRTLVALSSDGRSVDRAEVEVHSGARHLYAPGSDGHCFWLERTLYGRNVAAVSQRRVLSGPIRFWTLPRDLDTWFAPNPDPLAADRRSSGGELVALRQARCKEAPADVQRAVR